MENVLEKSPAELVEPSEKYKTSYIEALREFKDIDNDNSIDIEDQDKNFDLYLQKFENNKTLHNDEYVPDFQYWLVEGNKYIGGIKYRPILNEALKFRGGNAGYKVRPSERGKGYAPQMMQEIIKKAKSDGLTELLMTCDSDNIPSVKVIEKSGGVLQSTDIDEKGLSFNRYIIKL